MRDAVLHSDHGGLFGSISWSALIILALLTVAAWWMHTRGKSFRL